MRLRTLLSDFPKSILDAFQKCGVHTLEHMLFEITPEALFQRLPPGTITYQELVQARDRVLKALAADGVRGDQLLLSHHDAAESAEKAYVPWSTGIQELDLYIRAVKCGLVEIAGGKGTGKTALALHIAISCLVHDPNAKVHWIDTTGDFSAERAFRAERALNNQASGPSRSSPVTPILDRLDISLAFDIDAAHAILESLRLTLGSEAHDGTSHSKVRILVIDTITPLLGPLLSAVSSKGHAIMTTFMRQLQALAQAYSLLVLLTNNAASSKPSNLASAFSTTIMKPALGPSFTFLTDTTFWLARAVDVLKSDDSRNEQDQYTQPNDENQDKDDTSYILEVFRSRSAMARRWWTFRIEDGFVHIQRPAER